MSRRISQYLLVIKIFCLAVSILFLVQGMRTHKKNIETNTEARLFVVDRHTNTADQIATIEHYLQNVTGQAVALATYAS